MQNEEQGQFNFIEFANDKSSKVESLYSDWPIALVAPSALLPAASVQHILAPNQGIDLDSLFFSMGPNLCPIPDRMHPFISFVRISVKNILENIINNGGQLVESADVKFFIDLKQRYVKKFTVSNGRLIETTEILVDDNYKKFMIPQWLTLVCDSLIDFLLGNDLPRLKKCPFCKSFFVASDNRRNRKYCNSCSPKNKMTCEQRSAYMRERRAGIKKRKLALREKMIRELMRKDNMNRKEAEERLNEKL